MMIQLTTVEKYEEIIREGFVIAYFFSENCASCKTFSKVLDEIEYEIPFINIVKINIAEYPELGKKNEIVDVPTAFFINNGELLGRHTGVLNKEELKGKIREAFMSIKVGGRRIYKFGL